MSSKSSFDVIIAQQAAEIEPPEVPEITLTSSYTPASINARIVPEYFRKD